MLWLSTIDACHQVHHHARSALRRVTLHKPFSVSLAHMKRLTGHLYFWVLVAIVIGGLMFMFGEGGAKRQISGIVFGGGLALFAAQFLAWLF